MNKEEILNAFLLANIPEIITQEEFDDVKKAIKELLQENKNQKEVIDQLNELLSDEFLEVIDRGLLLDILKKYAEKENCKSYHIYEIKREIQSKVNTVDIIYKHRLNVANEYIDSRKNNMVPEHYDDLKYIINECDLDSKW